MAGDEVMGAVNMDRAAAMISMYRGGMTLAEIGDQYGLTRERVRQILAKAGVTSKEGGASARAASSRKEREAETDARYMQLWGCTKSFWSALRAMHDDYWESPVGKYYRQMKNAAARGIGWKLTLVEWWEIWQSSGVYDMRGLCSGQYVMARFGDKGPYAVGNVYITTSKENIREYLHREYPVEKDADAWLYARPLTPEQIYEQLERDDDR